MNPGVPPSQTHVSDARPDCLLASFLLSRLLCDPSVLSQGPLLCTPYQPILLLAVNTI